MPDALDQTITVTLPEGTAFAGEYVLRLGNCTSLEDLAVHAETGKTLWGLVRINNSEDGFGLLLAVAVAWLVRRREHPHTSFAEVASSVSWGDNFDVQWTFKDDEGEAEGSEEDIQKSSEPSPESSESTPGTSTD